MRKSIFLAAVLLCLAPGAAETSTASATTLGSRPLGLGDQGPDVKTLNWALRGEYLGTPYHESFTDETDLAVRSIQATGGVASTGIVERTTLKALAAQIPSEPATWYGPRLYGRRTACGVRLTKRTVGAAHRSLPCGTRVVLAHRGRWTRARVIDRGPYRKEISWDLTRRLAKRLGMLRSGLATIKVEPVP